MSGKVATVAEFAFERESRTPFSETYTIEQAGDEVGRVDLHFGSSGTVQATLCIPTDFDEDEIQQLIGDIDERLVLTSDPYRDDLIVTVWAGKRLGVYSEELEEEEDEEDDDAGENGREPVA